MKLKTFNKTTLLFLILTLLFVQLNLGAIAIDNTIDEEVQLGEEAVDCCVSASFEGEAEELEPMMAKSSGGTSVHYQAMSIGILGNIPNCTIYYTSTGGAPAPIGNGIAFSVAITNSFGNTISRSDLAPHNGLWNNFGHGNIQGAHTHTYTNYKQTNGYWSWDETVTQY